MFEVLEHQQERRGDPKGSIVDASAAAAAVDDHDRAIVAALGPVLRAHGLVIAGLDVIDGRLIEVNVTCPGGMHKTDALLGTRLSHTIVSSLFEGALV